MLTEVDIPEHGCVSVTGKVQDYSDQLGVCAVCDGYNEFTLRLEDCGADSIDSSNQRVTGTSGGSKYGRSSCGEASFPNLRSVSSRQ